VAVSKDDQALYLAIDQGGHASRALVFDARGHCYAQAEVAIATHAPVPSQVEHSPAEMVASVRAACEQVLLQLGEAAARVRAAGLATQRSSMVCWDRRTGQTLTPVISWQDTRAEEFVATLSAQTEMMRQKTGLFANAHYGASKMSWCLQHLPAVAQAAERGDLVMGPLASYLLFALLEERPLLADPANAQRTLLMDVQVQRWDDELLSLFGLNRAWLPTLVDCRFDFGHLQLGQWRIPLTVCTGDQSAALFAEGAPQSDCWYANLGTGGFVQRLCDDAQFAPRHLHSVVYSDGAQRWRVLEGTVNGAARALDWLAQQHPGVDWRNQLEGWLQVYTEPGLFVNQVSGLGSPFWRAQGRSYFQGAATIPQQFVAVLESIVFLLNHNMHGMVGQSTPGRVLLSGGLARSDGLCQRLADLAQLPVHRLHQHEATARGLAYLLAGLPEFSWQTSNFDFFSPRKNDIFRAGYSRFLAQIQ